VSKDAHSPHAESNAFLPRYQRPGQRCLDARPLHQRAPSSIQASQAVLRRCPTPPREHSTIDTSALSHRCERTLCRCTGSQSPTRGHSYMPTWMLDPFTKALCHRYKSTVSIVKSARRDVPGTLLTPPSARRNDRSALSILPSARQDAISALAYAEEHAIKSAACSFNPAEHSAGWFGRSFNLPERSSLPAECSPIDDRAPIGRYPVLRRLRSELDAT